KLDRAADRGATVDDDLVVQARRLALGARLHVARDLDRVLVQRIVRRDDEEVGELRGRAAHAWAVVVGACRGSENDDEPALRERTQLDERARQRTGGMREVDEHPEVLAQVDALETAAHPLEARDPLAHRFEWK